MSALFSIVILSRRSAAKDLANYLGHDLRAQYPTLPVRSLAVCAARDDKICALALYQSQPLA
jgi:hypothetical protein